MKETINLYLNKSILRKQCPSCNNFDHFINECPLITMNAKNSKVLSNYFKENFNQRKPFDRKSKRKFNSLFNLKITQEKTKSFEKEPRSLLDISGH